ncbi:MAG: L-aspartate oxidase [Bacteroidetes bacterium]|nr:L-aspartate oxidase [Bacteroidota bacterium]HET6245620.1 L-aspartate oxidase [Bacteroidia bacterium]
MQKQTDFLIIGSGIAGLSYALKVAEHGKVTILTKSNPEESNTKYAQGGIAVVTNQTDNIEKHIQDTVICGDGLCTESVVRMVVSQATDRLKELIEWGTNFDKTTAGDYDLAKEGGHSENRILHHKDITGHEIERALLEKINSHPNIEILDHYYALEILTQHHLGEYINSSSKNISCYGVYVLNLKTTEVELFLAKTTLMATGGAGHVYQTTTNPLIATGDGVAMVYRAKGKVENMEFFQFHPTALYNPGENPSFLITEAMRGHGGVLKTKNGKVFMHKYDKRKSLAPRDIVARAIDNELKVRGEDFVYLDCTSISKEELLSHFPNIYKKCKKMGIDICKDFIPVVPAAHYMCGGIKVDQNGNTSIKNLFAVGECASTGLHGANRLASNSLLEAIVYAHNAALSAIDQMKNTTICKGIQAWNTEGTANPEEMVLITQSLKELKAIMTNYVGIVRSDLRLKRAFDRLLILHNETEALYQRTTLSLNLCELRNMIKVGYIIIKTAMQRKESVGLHYNIDYPRNLTTKSE